MNNSNYAVGTGIGELHAARRPSLTDDTIPVEGYQVLRTLPGLLSVNINNGVRLASPLSSINKKLSSLRRAAKNIWRGGLSTCLFKMRARFWIAPRFLPAVCGFAPPSPLLNKSLTETEHTFNFTTEGGKKENNFGLSGLLSFIEKAWGNPATSFSRSRDTSNYINSSSNSPFNTNEGCEK